MPKKDFPEINNSSKEEIEKEKEISFSYSYMDV